MMPPYKIFASLWRRLGTSTVVVPVREELTVNLRKNLPFLDFYESATGKKLSDYQFAQIKKQAPSLTKATAESLERVQRVLGAQGIAPSQLCAHPALITIHPYTLDSHCRVLQECGFSNIEPQYLIKYHSLVRYPSIRQLKQKKLIPSNLNLEEQVIKHIDNWPETHPVPRSDEITSTIVQVRMKILRKYLHWRLAVTDNEFEKICRCYIAIKHRPMAKIQETIELMESEVNFSAANIKRNSFLLLADPANVRLILQIKELTGVDIRQVIRMAPAIIRNNHASILKIRDILQEYRIPADTQRRCLSVYCLAPNTVKERLEHLSSTKEYQMLSSNPRALQMVVHYKKLLGRLKRLQSANKTCYSLGNLLSSNKTFEAYLASFGNKICSRDLASVICSSLNVDVEKLIPQNYPHKSKPVRQTTSGESIVYIARPTVDPYVHFTQEQLKRHTYWRHIPHHIVHENIDMLKKHFDDEAIYKHCQLLLYPMADIERNLEIMKGVRAGESIESLDSLSPHLDYRRLTDEQTLSLLLYSLERTHHFTGNGIWSGSDNTAVS